MLTSQPLIIDPAQQAEVNQVLPYIPDLASSPSDTPNVLVLHFDRHPSHEVPNYTTTQHVIPVWGLQSQAKIEAKLDQTIKRQGMFGCGAAGVIPIGTNHWVVWDRPIELTVIFLHPSFVNQVAAETIKGDRVELIPKHEAEDPALTQLGLLLKSDLAEGHTAGRLYRESIATAMAARLVQHHAVCHFQTRSAGLAQSQIQILFAYIQDSLCEDINLADLARLVNLSEYHLCRAFKRSVGMPLYQYVIQQRVERAKLLLQRRNLTIAQIATQCGFSSHSHLTRHFKRLVGVSPCQARSK